MQNLEDSLEEAEELGMCTAAKHFIVFRQKLDRFLNAVKMYKLRFQTAISPMLVEIRGGGKEESELGKLLENHAASPFNVGNLGNWLGEIRAESAVLKSFVMILDKHISFGENEGEY